MHQCVMGGNGIATKNNSLSHTLSRYTIVSVVITQSSADAHDVATPLHQHMSVTVKATNEREAIRQGCSLLQNDDDKSADPSEAMPMAKHCEMKRLMLLGMMNSLVV